MCLMQIGWAYEGVLCEVPEKSDTPVYRLYNPNSGEHHYTPNAGERCSFALNQSFMILSRRPASK